MQIVIDIDEDTYKDIKKGKVYSSVRDVPQESVLAIANGTPLPEPHGRIIDESKIHEVYTYTEEAICKNIKAINTIITHTDAPTIIEADRGE